MDKHRNTETLLVTREDGLAVVRLNRPDAMNALTETMAREIAEIMGDFSDDDQVRAVLLTGTGRAFCAGMDLSGVGWGGASPSEASFITKRIVSRLNRAFLAMIELEKPIVCAVNGVAAGGGLSMAMSSDIVIASEAARFSTVAVRRGLFPDVGMNYLLPRIVGLQRARQLLLTGDIIDAFEAERMGLVNKVVLADRLEEEATSLARRLARGPTKSMGLSKVAIRRGLNSDIAESMEMESWGQGLNLQTDDVREGITAFVEKREPDFQGR